MNDTTTPEAIIAPALLNRRYKRITLLALFATFIVTVPLEIVLSSDFLLQRTVVIASTLAGSFVMVVWCYFDSREHGWEFGKGMQITVVLLGVFGLLIYLIKNRGVWRGLLSFFTMIGLIIAMMIVTLIITTLVVIIFGVQLPQ